jgi:hypothetical protein
LGCLALLFGLLTLVASFRWANRALPHAQTWSMRALRCFVILLACASGQVPTLLSLSQTHSATIYVLRNACQNFINVFTVPPFLEPDVRKER